MLCAKGCLWTFSAILGVLKEDRPQPCAPETAAFTCSPRSVQWLLYCCARSVALLAPQAGADLLLGARQEQRFDCALQAIGIESKFGVPLLVNPTCEFD